MYPDFDYYLSHRARQPKKEIADYVSSEGLLVPQRFQSLKAALASELPFIVRSEHPQDYDGVSGLLQSMAVKSAQKRSALMQMSQDDVEQQLSGEHRGLNVYCFLTDTSFEEFVRDVSYSYWELIGGQNRSVVADSAIAGRYHIFTSGQSLESPPYTVNNYTVWENGGILISVPYPLEPEFVRGLPKIVDFYEQVRHLPRFNPNHCPLIEAQTDNGQIYFLQYLRTQDFEKPTFSLDRDPEIDETEALLVRGATPAEGKIYKTRGGLLKGTEVEIKGECNLDQMEASFRIHWSLLYEEFMCRRRQAEFIAKNLDDVAVEATHDHPMKSELFKPKLSVVIHREEAILKIFSRYPGYEPRGGWGFLPPYINIRVVSDGRRAYIKPILR